MSTTTITPMPSDAASHDNLDDALQYRAIHSGALVGLLLGIVSVAIVFAASASLGTALMLLPIAVAGMIVSLLAERTIRKNPDQFIGRPAAVLGAVLALVFAVSGVAYGGYVYLTEVPDGYERISFLTMKPDKADELAGRGVPEEIVNLLGKRVFIKGYIRPDSIESRENISEFLLVRDSNTCCFGDLSKVKYYDQMQIKCVPNVTTEYDGGLYRVGGTLVLSLENLNRGPGYPVFALVADHVVR